MKVGDRVRYFTGAESGVLADVWFEPTIGWIAEVECDDGFEYTCFLGDLVPA